LSARGRTRSRPKEALPIGHELARRVVDSGDVVGNECSTQPNV
jgi:hypothetical protein